jgi:hypothetical protein
MTRFITAFLVALTVNGAAEAACPQPYTPERLGGDLSAMASALRSANPLDYQTAGEQLTAQLPCVDAPLAPVVLASVYRYAGLYHYFAGDLAQAKSWFRTALELDSTFDWDVAEVAVEDPIRPIFEAERVQGDRIPVDIGENRELAVPEGRRLLVDGRVLREAKLTPDRPHLVQLVEIEGNRVESVWLIAGTELPDELLKDGNVAAIASGPSAGGGVAVERIERARPPLKTPALIGGGLLMAGGAGLYAMSFGAHQKWENATTTSGLETNRTLTNALVMAAGATVAAGAGMTWVGVSLDGTPSVNWAVGF